MEVDSAVRDHQQTNQEESNEVEPTLSQCEAVPADNSPEDRVPVNQTEPGEDQEVNLRSGRAGDDNTEQQRPGPLNGHGQSPGESHGDNCANDIDEQIDVVNSDHDDNEAKPTDNNAVAVAEENDEPGPVEQSGEKREAPVEDTNEIQDQDQETTNENHEESRSQETKDNAPAEPKESQHSGEEGPEFIPEKVGEDVDNNDKNSAEHDEGFEDLVTEVKDTAGADNQQVQAESAEEVADDPRPDENETNPEPFTASADNEEGQEGNTAHQTEDEKEEVPQEHENSEPSTNSVQNCEPENELVPRDSDRIEDSRENGDAEDESISKESEEVPKDHDSSEPTESLQNGEKVEEEFTEDSEGSQNQESESVVTEVEDEEISEENVKSPEKAEEIPSKKQDVDLPQAQGNLLEMEDEILSLDSSQSEPNCANTDKMEVDCESSKQTSSVQERGGDRDQLEENLECILPPKEENDVSEQVLVDDDDMVVTQITSIDELEVSQGTNGHAEIVDKAKIDSNGNDEAANIDQFTEVEDLIIHALDTVSPFDAKFISDHMPGRDEQQIERRLTDHSFRKLSFTFQKLPFLMFEMIFVSENKERSSSLMLLTQKSLLQLKNKHGWCETNYNLEVLELRYNSKTRFGIDVGALCEFIITNIPSVHMPYLRRNVREIEAFLEASNINYRKPNTKRDLKQLLNKVQQEVTMESLRVEGKHPIRIDEEGEVHLTEEHEDMLRKIVANVGVNHWEEVTKLLLAVFEYDVDVDLDDEEIYDKIKCYYESKLDPNLSSGFFTEDEDKCIIYMYKYWSKIMEDDTIWKQISQHLVGRSANQVKNRFLRTSQSALDLTLENIIKYPDDKTNPATFNSDLAHMYSLIVVQKNLATDLEITSKLQHETRYLVMGTRMEMFILPCKDTAIRPHHPGVVQHTFTYDPARPPQQFVTFVKLTFGNGLKKLGLLEDPDSFNFNNIELHSPSIHQMMEEADRDRCSQWRNLQ